MNFTSPFSNLNKHKASIAGGKGASLGEMLNAGIPVPNGFVVLSDTFEHFLSETDLSQEIESILERVDHKAIHTIDAASENIRNLILSKEIPEHIKSEILSSFNALNAEFVAVRSSATAEDGADHAWAGQLESYLNVTEPNVLEKVQHCWSSLFTPRAIFYRFEKGLHQTKISVAVVVQKMVNSEKSGIAFSVHPVTEDRNQIIIEAGLGLGEAVVSGAVTPDSYVVSKEPRNIVDINVNNQNRALYRKEGGGNGWIDLDDAKAGMQVLSKEEILKLSNIIMTIENHYGFPCDIEWAYEKGEFFVVQSRPITTLSSTNSTERIDFEKAYTRDTTLIIQQAWNACASNPFYSSGTNPHLPPVIHYMSDGVIEVWENAKATEWIMDSVQELIAKDESKLIALIDQYEKDLEEIKGYWERGPITDVEEFAQYVDRVFVVMKGFDCMYFPSVDERTPLHIRERTLKMRDTDSYFDSNDKLMRSSLIAMYPHLKGYEQCILKNEIKNPPSIDVLKKRRQNFVIIGEEFAEQITLSEYQSKHPEYHFRREIPPADASTLIGHVGNKGYAKGIVRMMKRKDQIADAIEGDIIVSTMTTPDFVPAMQKAAAIITDEGGITCHAAIVARELNKPCVIGTKFATEILSDGDEVEVDADNGIVRIVKKNIVAPELKRENYMLSFWVQGVNTIVTDISRDMYKTLGVVYVIDRGVYKQYFEKRAFDRALEEGVQFYGDQTVFDAYKNELDALISEVKAFYEKEIKEQSSVSRKAVQKFFEYSVSLCTRYGKMDFEYTDKAFTLRDENPVIDRNLKMISTYKDEVRAFLNAVFFNEDAYLAQLVAILSAQFGITKTAIENSLRSEILGLFNGATINEESVRGRVQYFVASNHPDGKPYYEGKEAEEIARRFEEKVEKGAEIKGQVANKGTMKGVVRIVPVDYGNPARVNQAIESMNNGDVLVAETTAPELIVACKKAGAIVTDMGGMMSHAAIVSREFGIPCIVGTQNASRILKDGDMVEVDANSGIVRIIS